MRRALTVGAAAICAALAGCTSSGPHRSSAPPTSASLSSAPATSAAPPSTSAAPTTPTPTTSIPTTGANVRPGEKPPTRPPVADRNTSLGAIALSTYWFRTLDWGYATTSSALPRSVYTAACTDCTRFMGDYDSVAHAKQHYRGGRIQILESANVSGDHRFGGQRVADVVVRTSRLQTVDATGHVTSTSPAIRRAEFLVYMRWTGGQGYVVAFKEVRK